MPNVQPDHSGPTTNDTAITANPTAARIRRLAEWAGNPADAERLMFAAAAIEDRETLRAVMQSILDDADMAYYERRQGDWFLLRLKQALDSGSTTHSDGRK